MAVDAVSSAPADGAPASSRLIFANQLRGVAALMVLIVHLIVVAQFMRPDVAWVVAAPPITTPVSHVAAWLKAWPIDLAATGVGLFFLISGFVIPFSIEKTTAGGFLLARAARIFPTFWMALGLEWIFIHCSGVFWSHSSPFGWKDYVVNGLLLSSVLHRGSVDWVSWTLSIEVKFYLLAAVCRAAVLFRSAGFAMSIAVLVFMINVAARSGVLPLPDYLVGEATFLSFITIGVLFHAHHKGRLGMITLAIAVAAVMTLVLLCWRHGPLAGEFRGRSRSLTAALALFTVAYMLRSKFKESRVLDFIAAISYPLYLIHAVIGFTIIYFLIGAWHVPYPGAATIALVLCIGLATALHVSVENPTIRLGHQIARKSMRVAGRPETGSGPCLGKASRKLLRLGIRSRTGTRAS